MEFVIEFLWIHHIIHLSKQTISSTYSRWWRYGFCKPFECFQYSQIHRRFWLPGQWTPFRGSAVAFREDAVRMYTWEGVCGSQVKSQSPYKKWDALKTVWEGNGVETFVFPWRQEADGKKQLGFFPMVFPFRESEEWSTWIHVLFCFVLFFYWLCDSEWGHITVIDK